MTNFQLYRQMVKEADRALTAEEIGHFIRKYREMPRAMINELQAKLDVINRENQLSGRGGIHIISHRRIR